MQTVPQAIGMLGTSEGRSQLLTGIEKFPADFAKGLVDFFKTPGTAMKQGLTPEQETEFGLNAALGTIGEGAFKVPSEAVKAVAPIMKSFDNGVMAPTAERIVDEHAQAAAVSENAQVAGKDTQPIGEAIPGQETPQPQEGMTRLYRGERDWGPYPNEQYRPRAQFWTSDPARAADYGSVRYVDVSPEELAKNFSEDFKGDYQTGDADSRYHEMAQEVPPIVQAKDLGVIGPDQSPPVQQESPAVAAARAIPAAADTGDKITMTPSGEPIDAWEQRFNRYVDNMQSPDDFKGMIKQLAIDNNNFSEARAGAVPAVQIEKVAEAAGIDPADIDGGKLRTTFRTDDEIRIATQTLKKLGDDVQSAAELVRADDSPDNLIKMQAAIIKRDYAMEAALQHTVALRAEWGRSGNALQEILAVTKDQAGLTSFLKDKGRSTDDLRDMARGLAGLDREQAAKVLTAQRGQAPHWFYWTWVQGLISGLVTHSKYVAANALYAGTERGVVTPLASLIGTMRGGADKVFLGEAAAMHYGTIAAVPDAVRAAFQTVKSGMRVPLESEQELARLAEERGEKPPKEVSRAVNPVTQQRGPRWGIWERVLGEKGQRVATRVLGLPGDMASAIHTTFKVLGERANLEAWAYNKAAGEGLSPANQTFWERRAYHAANPSEQVLKDSVYQAYKDTFMQELGPHAKTFQALTRKIPLAKWIFPFAHIPINLMKATYEYTPFAALDKDMRGNLTGANGGRAQDLAIARMTVGSSVMGYFAHKYMMGQATGDYPTDPKERKDWQLQGKIPNSIMIGDHWVSFDRFGPAGDLARIGANVGSLIHHSDQTDDDNWTKLTFMAANGAANTIADEVGFQSLRNIMDALSDERKGRRWAAWQAGSLMPYSSLVSQTASIMDPQMRVAQTFLDGLKYRTPGLRESLLPKRDPLYGQPMTNPGYENIIRKIPVDTDPVKGELERLDLHPAAPRNQIGGVKLSPEQYDRYEATAGPLVRQALSALVSNPAWQNIPAGVRKQTMQATISAMRQRAAAAMQMDQPELVQQGLQRRLARINGQR